MLVSPELESAAEVESKCTHRARSPFRKPGIAIALSLDTHGEKRPPPFVLGHEVRKDIQREEVDVDLRLARDIRLAGIRDSRGELVLVAHERPFDAPIAGRVQRYAQAESL